MSQEPEPFIDVHALQRGTGLPASYWYARAERGEVPSYKVGKYRRFRMSEVRSWIEARREGPAVAANR